MLFGELALAAQVLESALKLLCEVLKHWSSARYPFNSF